LTGARLLVDGGGTTTRVALACAGGEPRWVEREGRSCNPRSVGRARALENLNDLVRLVWQHRPAGVGSLESAWLCLSTVSSRGATESFAADLLELAPPPLREVGALWLTNDVAPLLVHDGRVTDRVVVICGTGTGFCGLNVAEGRIARASGREYLLADEGGGFDLGLQGLRAVVRADDGRGPRTRLTELLAAWRGVQVSGLFDLVYASPEPKVLIGSFAPFVLAAAEEGDECARAITAGAAAELVTGIRAVVARTGLPDAFEVVLVGSTLVGRHAVVREQLVRSLGGVLPRVAVHPLAGSTLAPVAHLAALLPGDPRLAALLASCMPVVRIEEGLLRPAGGR
jgi:N-acetylglucosamine kinase-like BadF-type ATPase